MSEEYEAICFHKTTPESASKILQFSTFPISTGQTQWLGDGVYFWEQLSDAEWWRSKQYKHGTILSAELRCETKKFLDLDDSQSMDRMATFASEWKRKTKGKRINFSSDKQMHSFFSNLYKKAYDISLIKYSFPWTEKNPAGFQVVRRRSQYCATSNEIINNIQKI